MDGVRLGINISLANKSKITVTAYERETGKSRQIDIKYQSFIKRLLGNHKWYKEQKFVVDNINFGYDTISDI